MIISVSGGRPTNAHRPPTRAFGPIIAKPVLKVQPASSPISVIVPSLNVADLAIDGIHHLRSRRIGSYEFDTMVIKEWDGRKPVVFCGPWVGEFGWELMHWRPKALKVLMDHPYHHRIIVADLGHQPLYQGAYEEYWSIRNLPGGGRKSCHKNKGWEGGVMRALLKALKPQIHLSAYFGFEPTVSVPVSSTATGRALLQKITPSFVIFPRAKAGNRNWPRQAWNELIKELTKLGQVINSGRREDSLFDLHNVLHTESLAGGPRFEMDVTLAALERARAAICTDSGGMHIALHTKVKTIVIGRLTRFPRCRQPEANVDSVEGVLKACF